MGVPSMPKYSLIRNISICFLFLYLSVYSQTVDFHSLYSENRISEIEDLLLQNKINHAGWEEFAKALFEENWEIAIQKYIAIYLNTQDNQIQRAVLDRISQYYYAKGLYDSANRIINDENFRKRIFSINTKKIYFGIQLAAYSSYENAIKGRDQHSKKIDNTNIMTKESGGKKLYVIVAGKFSSRQEAESYQKQLREELGIQGIIVQF